MPPSAPCSPLDAPFTTASAVDDVESGRIVKGKRSSRSNTFDANRTPISSDVQPEFEEPFKVSHGAMKYTQFRFRNGSQ